MQKKIFVVSRIVLGLIFFIAGLAGLFNLLPPPPEMPVVFLEFMKGMMAAKYFFPLLKATEMLAGFFLLIGIAPALMLLILAPISLHIFLVNLYLTSGFDKIILPTVIIILHGLASVNYWSLFKPLLKRDKIFS